MNTQHQIIEEIHAHFEVDLSDLIRAEFESISTNPALKKLLPAPGYDGKKFLSELQAYKAAYTQNYISVEQVKAICLKYKLVCAPLFLYKEQIPERNIAELSNFRLMDADRMHTVKIPHTISTKGNIVFKSAPVALADSAKDFLVYDFTPTLQAVCSGNMVYIVGYSSLDFGIPFYVQSFKRDLLKIEVQNGFTHAVISLPDSLFLQGAYIDLSQRCIPLIVAPYAEFYSRPISGVTLTSNPGGKEVIPHNPEPEKHLAYTANANKLKTAYVANQAKSARVIAQQDVQRRAADKIAAQKAEELKAEQQRKIRENPIQDPIILHPLPKGGYLVITKWGPEAMIPEIQNAGSN